MGMWLIIWDKLFGTFQEELPEDKPVYGLVGGSDKNLRGPVNVIFHEFKDIWKDFFVTHRNLPLTIRLKYVFAPPGWSHDGSRKTSQQLRQEAGLEKQPTDSLEHVYNMSNS
jgi:hypothetical protein